MTPQYKKQISKFLSLILRHQPEKIGLQLDENGWALINDILDKSNLKFTFVELEEIVVTNDKQRFSFNADKTKIRANQGHSLKTVDLDLKAQVPPEFLFHGTVERFIGLIKSNGLQKMKRQHVHLSANKGTAIKVGSRRGKPIILTIKALEMQRKGYKFYKSENGVWLTDEVPVELIIF
ncbi:RNA 2'-phosphotransferase [Polaribacter porphyrae]|uniref:Probable RNA 2'-phosphotransferase n=1 Tax=Polaribacter porphyrae TaxID=1137780 RepID=A0A2S7WN57_9FLAO|nr:RNA 2'-phosphotransferase [Polaribacter porphyrae]PQJ79023.1 RNA 2'-phosphotransferase [Polaribacter porphyrae]